MATILMTSAAGRIGTLLRHHWHHTHHLIGLDTRSYKPLENEEAYPVDIQTTELWTILASREIKDRLGEQSPVLVHLAAVTWDTAGWTHLEETNIRGTYNVFSLARDIGASRVIFASSNHVTGGYGDWAPSTRSQLFDLPPTVTANMPVRPDSLYGVSKAFGEALSAYYAWKHHLPVICLRIGSVTNRNDPRENPRLRSTWLSHRDLCHLFDCCLAADVQFGTYYGVSNNTRRFWDLSNAERELSYRPQDNAELWYTEKGKTDGQSP